MTTQRLSRKIIWVFPIAALALVIMIALMSAGRAQATHVGPPDLHGIAFSKGCVTPAGVGDPYDCFYSVSNPLGLPDSADDTLTVTSLIDVIHAGTQVPPGTGDVTSANLLPLMTVLSFTGAPLAFCDNGAGPGNTICTLPAGSSITFNLISFYNIAAGDPNPMLDTATIVWQDLCDQGSPNCPGNVPPLENDTGSQVAITSVPTVTTEIHENGGHSPDIQGTTIIVGTSVHDMATVSGSPAGSVQFDGFANTDCSGSPTDLGTIALAAGVADPSGSLVVGLSGASFIAHYLGDGGLILPADGPCEWVAGEKLIAQLVTEIHEDPHDVVPFGATRGDGTMVHDKVTVSGSGATPTGNVTITLYDNSTCSGGSLTVDVVALGGGMAESSIATIGTTTTGSSLSYTASYAGDSIYHPIATGDAVPACEHMAEKSVGGVTEFFASDSGTSYGLWAGYAAVAAIIVAVSVLFARRRLAR